MPGGRRSGSLARFPDVLAPKARFVAWSHQQRDADSPRVVHASGYALGRPDDAEPLVVLGIDTEPVSVRSEFAHDGRYLAWGSLDGAATLVNLEEVRRNLAELGLGW